jgi:predicted ribosome quality control (RQC) complex YloA/Tae2 family protein
MPRVVTSFDSVVLAAIAREIGALVGSRVGRVVQPDPEEVAIELRGRTAPLSVLVSIHARWGRVHLIERVTGADLSTFGQLLRSRLEGARLTAVQQMPFERVLRLTFDTLEGGVDLVAEIMGRHSNLILIQNGLITGSLKTVPAAKSALRPVRPGSPYTPPPVDRPSPSNLTEDGLRQLLISSDDPLAKHLVASVLGLSPVLATELVVRARLDPAAPANAQSDATAQLWTELRNLVRVVQTQAFTPTIYLDGDQPIGFAPFPYAHLASLPHRPVASMSEAVAATLGRFGHAARVDEQRMGLLTAVRAALARVARREVELRQAIEEAARTGRLRQHGELLLTYAAQVPAGASEVTLPGYDGMPTTIPLDPALSAAGNAQQLFKRYKRVRDARATLANRLSEAEAERAYLESVQTLIAQATTAEDLADLRQELADEGYLRRTTRRATRPSAKSAPRRFAVEGGRLVLVGRTNRQNDTLTFKTAAPEDLWLHARGVPGAHVILKTDGKAPSEEAIRQAAALAAFFSQAREEASVPVDYTPRKYVRRPQGGKPGLVTYTHEQTLRVSPAAPDAWIVDTGGGRKERPQNGP